MKYLNINEDERKRIINLHQKSVNSVSEQEDMDMDMDDDNFDAVDRLSIELEFPQELCDFLKNQGIEDVSECKDIFADYAIYSVGSQFDGFLEEFDAWWRDNSDAYLS